MRKLALFGILRISWDSLASCRAHGIGALRVAQVFDFGKGLFGKIASPLPKPPRLERKEPISPVLSIILTAQTSGQQVCL